MIKFWRHVLEFYSTNFVLCQNNDVTLDLKETWIAKGTQGYLSSKWDTNRLVYHKQQKKSWVSNQDCNRVSRYH